MRGETSEEEIEEILDTRKEKLERNKMLASKNTF